MAVSLMVGTTTIIANTAENANQDFSFDQIDLVQVLQAAKFMTGETATWSEGDWDGGPGGEPGSPPQGNGLFDQFDVIAALATGKYMSGPYAAIRPGGIRGDEQTSIIYDARTGEIAVDTPASTELTSINIDSAACVFTGAPADLSMGSGFVGTSDNDSDCNMFKTGSGRSFGSGSFGNVAEMGLGEAFVRNDLTVVGTRAGGGLNPLLFPLFGTLSGSGDLGPVDLIYTPEPSSLLLALLGLVGLLHWRG